MSESAITKRQQHWLDHLKAAKTYDGSVADYARAEGLTPKELYQWKTILRRRGLIAGKAKPSAFVPVRQADTAGKAALVLPNGARLELSGTIDASTIKALILAASELG